MDIQPIGTIHSPHASIENMPIQPKGAKDIEGYAVIDEKYHAGLRDLEGFTHIYLLYHFHQADRTELTVTPFMDHRERGVFSTRSPLRPNHIGMSIVELVKIDGNKIVFRGVDILDGTPLLDVKPYVDAFDKVENSTSGWMQGGVEDVRAARSDNRFG